MDKVTLITARYGEEINGGAEVHCRMLAKKLKKNYEVEILTTRVLDHKNFDEYYPGGTDEIKGIKIKRFNILPFDAARHNDLKRKIRYSRKLRRVIYRLRLTRLFFYFFPVWHLLEDEEYSYLQSNGFYSQDLLDYVKSDIENIKALILLSYPYPLTHFCSMIAPEKTILIPTAHEESMLFYSVNTQLFNRVAHIAFNTETEQKLCQNIFSRGMAANSIVSTGIELAEPADYAAVSYRYKLPEKYVLYFGRVCKAKIGKLFEYFLAYKKQYNDDLCLVITGEIFMDELPPNDFIKFTGFVSEAEKTAIINGATIVVNPSPLESLSLLVLEAMKLGKQVIVNGKCKVLKQHCIDSNYAAGFYDGKNDFCNKLNYYYTHPEIRERNKTAARKYVAERYDWGIIMSRLENIIKGLKNPQANRPSPIHPVCMPVGI